MKFSLKAMNGFILAGMLSASGAAIAQTEIGATASPASSASSAATQPGPGGGQHMMGQRDPSKMQARMARRMAGLKTKLMITPTQEGAWTAFSLAMQPTAHMGALTSSETSTEQRAGYANLTTPERIDKMRTLRTERMRTMAAAMDQRGEATKRFYAALNADQQKTFDAEQLKMAQGRGHRYDRDHHEGDLQMKR